MAGVKREKASIQGLFRGMRFGSNPHPQLIQAPLRICGHIVQADAHQSRKQVEHLSWVVQVEGGPARLLAHCTGVYLQENNHRELELVSGHLMAGAACAQ